MKIFLLNCAFRYFSDANESKPSLFTHITKKCVNAYMRVQNSTIDFCKKHPYLAINSAITISAVAIKFFSYTTSTYDDEYTCSEGFSKCQVPNGDYSLVGYDEKENGWVSAYYCSESNGCIEVLMDRINKIFCIGNHCDSYIPGQSIQI